MDYEKINPCSAEWYAKAMAWAETGCWCCTATRSMFVGLWLGAVIALALCGHSFASFVTLVVGAPVEVAVLMIARRIWAESYRADEETQEPPQ